MLHVKSLIVKIGLAVVIIALSWSLFTAYSTISQKNKEIYRLENTITLTQEEVIHYKDENNQLHTKNNVLSVDYELIKNANNNLIKTVEKQRKELKIKLKDVNVVTVNVTKTDTILKTVVKDSCYTYQDSYNNFVFCKDSSSISIQDTVSLIIYNRKVIPNRSKFFFVRWFQKKTILQEIDIIHKNPLIKTVDNKTIINKN